MSDGDFRMARGSLFHVGEQANANTLSAYLLLCRVMASLSSHEEERPSLCDASAASGIIVQLVPVNLAH